MPRKRFTNEQIAFALRQPQLADPDVAISADDHSEIVHFCASACHMYDHIG